MRVREAFETSDKLAEQGVKCAIEFGGKVIAHVWVRPADVALNSDYRNELANTAQIIKAAGGDLDDKTDRELLWKVFARTVVSKWEWTDPEDQKDKTLKLNEANAVDLFEKLPKFFEAIQRASKNWTNYRSEFEEDASGN